MRGQTSFFSGEHPFKIGKPIRLIELFAGIGSQAKALSNLGIDFEHHFVCEWDKYAVTSYNAIHLTNFMPADITALKGENLGITDTTEYCYILTYSFPCQDLSKAGKQKGMGAGTRSGLLWEVERLLNECTELPQVLLMENVPDVLSEKFRPDFYRWCDFLESKGYKNYHQVLNAKHYGIPQNRERCFMVSVLGDYYYEFPEPVPLELRLKDMLELEVDDKYYLSDEAVQKILTSDFSQEQNRIQWGLCQTLCARDYKGPPCVAVQSEVEGAEALTATRGIWSRLSLSLLAGLVKLTLGHSGGRVIEFMTATPSPCACKLDQLETPGETVIYTKWRNPASVQSVAEIQTTPQAEKVESRHDKCLKLKLMGPATR